jgi:hypothetical protein
MLLKFTSPVLIAKAILNIPAITNAAISTAQIVKKIDGRSDPISENKSFNFLMIKGLIVS